MSSHVLPYWGPGLGAPAQPNVHPGPVLGGLLANAAGDREFRRALNDLNHRLRNALGEYDERREPMPVP
jgi:hypothetical protein